MFINHKYKKTVLDEIERRKETKAQTFDKFEEQQEFCFIEDGRQKIWSFVRRYYRKNDFSDYDKGFRLKCSLLDTY